MTKKNETLTLAELATEAGTTPRKVWEVLLGEKTNSIDLAVLIEKRLGISAQALMFRQQDRVRPNALSWVADYLGVTPQSVWRYINASVMPGIKIRYRLCEFAGVEPFFWNAKYEWNWMITKAARQALEKKKKEGRQA